MTVSPQLWECLRRLPKAELHVHLDGSLRPETLLELASLRGVPLPEHDIESLRSYMRADNTKNLEEYLARFSVTLSVMQDFESLERIAYELVLDGAADGVRYMEVRWCPALHTDQGMSHNDAIRAVQRGLQRAENESGTVARSIICALRHMGVKHAEEMADLVIEHRNTGVVALDLAGAERGYPAREYASVFRRVLQSDIPVTIHAGEGDGAHSIREAIHLCGALRIGHGTRLAEDASLLGWVRDRNIPLELCPTSNVQTRVSSTFSEHQLKFLFDAGVTITINTDNRLISDVTLTEEYARCYEHLGFSVNQLADISRNSFSASFLPLELRSSLLSSVEMEFEKVVLESRAFEDSFSGDK